MYQLEFETDKTMKESSERKIYLKYTDDFDASSLNEFEHTNAYFIRQYEKLYGLN
ncbi:hypothetical protein lbkm_1743 [Lachnospiraceae bacterium KM106-2]|nr:hypothetical protein lbkm_1743 [Lachnospiraceae bacterium KM106-2]